MSTYSDRPDLSKELDEKLARQHAASPRVVAVIGLGGTGKTQLVLHHIEERGAEYDTVLWIDVRDKETARASFERCCRALGLPVETSPEDRLLHDVPCVQAVLIWLQARGEEKRWLTVIDNADDLAWDISSVIPRGKAGTVLVTSQDGHAALLLGGRMPTMKVDAMQPEEAVRLIANHFDEPVTRGDCYWDLVERITECLDRLALPLDLAGARISVDAENWGDLTHALRQYLEDYQHNQERLLHDTEYANATQYKKTAWTAWETSLSSLKAKERHADIYPVQLLAFLTLFDRANVQDELFRLASLGLDDACAELDATIHVPSWLRKLLEKDGDSEWMSLQYRNTIACLLRYGLVRPIVAPWKGVTMHGLVQTRAQQELPPGYLRLYMIFLFAICTCVNEADYVRFRRFLTVHLPPIDMLLTGQPPFKRKRHMARVWGCISTVFENENRLQEAAQLSVKAVATMRNAFGDKDLETLDAMSNLAVTFMKQGLLHEAKDLNSEVMRLKEAALGAQHPATLWNRDLLTIVLMEEGRYVEAMQQQTAVLEAKRVILGNDHRDTLNTMTTLASTCSFLAKMSRAQELQEEVIATQERLFGRAHRDVIQSKSNLAMMYLKLGKHREADELHLEAIQAARDLLGDEHEDTLRCMAQLCLSCEEQGKLREAEELQMKILGNMERIYGGNHPRTLKHKGNLALTGAKQGKWMEAEKVQIEVLEGMTRSYGEDNRETLDIMGQLVNTLQNQARWEEASDLASKAMAISSRALGESHSSTLRAMANLAHTKRGLGQRDVAIDLMRRSAVAYSEVLGDDHPLTKELHELAAEWSGEESARVSDMDRRTGKDVDASIA